MLVVLFAELDKSASTVSESFAMDATVEVVLPVEDPVEDVDVSEFDDVVVVKSVVDVMELDVLENDTLVLEL